jgi:hypothetical protein
MSLDVNLLPSYLSTILSALELIRCIELFLDCLLDTSEGLLTVLGVDAALFECHVTLQLLHVNIRHPLLGLLGESLRCKVLRTCCMTLGLFSSRSPVLISWLRSYTQPNVVPFLRNMLIASANATFRVVRDSSAKWCCPRATLNGNDFIC